MKNTKGERKGPGRPPIRPPRTPLEKKGIVDNPFDIRNKLELVFCDPVIFKSLFSYFKNVKSREIHLKCHPKGLNFYARDHSKSSRIIANISGNYVNHYFCKDTFWVGLNRESVEKMFQSIDKSFSKILITYIHDDPNSLTFVFKDDDIDKECNYKITLSSYAIDEELIDIEGIISSERLRAAFPIEFTLTSKQFKKSITDASYYSDVVTFEKIGEDPLNMTYTKSNMIYNEVYKNPAKIKLQSDVKNGTIFRCTVKVANIKSLASSMVTDTVRILCGVNGILFVSAIDVSALVVNTLTELC
jgi:hypothetical protein